MKILILLVLFLLPMQVRAEGTITIISAEPVTNTITVQPEGHTIFLTLNKIAYTTYYNNKTICLQNVLFFNFHKGVVLCGHQITDTVFKVNPTTDPIPDNLYLSFEELQR